VKGALDWTSVSDDPNSTAAKAAVREWLAQARRLHLDCDVLGLAESLVRGKRVLDIGVVSHSARYFDQAGWRHGRISRAAAYCLGLDILAPLVEELRSRGFNVRCVDATSEEDLGERFEIVFAGDVIEHVDSAVALLRFAGRHLAPGGRLYVTTPNAFSRKFYRQFRREGVMVTNLDHVAWISPTMALELGRRAGVRLEAYHLAKPYAGLNRALHQLLWQFTPAEYAFPEFVYEFRRAADILDSTGR
jgi:2-polyprenyl-3-methyl-5-hydroxy-6-metoxy-1,4-benzoquinol methylase